MQAVKAACKGKHASRIVVLPLDITAEYKELENAASTAMEAFSNGEQALGIQYLVHNAGKQFSEQM